jgi:alpha-L-fucosidase
MEKKLVMGDYYTPEQYIPQDLDMNFETCMTLNDTWGYKYYDQNWKDTETVIKNLVLNASMGGNYLLNVGPDHLGNIPSTSVQILKSAGHWLDVNGESIYGTKKSPLEHVFYDYAACTVGENNKLYIHLFRWPETDELVIGEIKANITNIYFLADKAKTNITYQLFNENDYILDLNPANIDKTVLNQEVKTLVIEYTGKLKPQELPPIIDPFNTASFTPANASFSGNIDYGFNHRWGDHRGYELKEWNKGGTMSWNFRTIRKGKYAIEVVYGANELSDDNDIMVSVGGRTIKHKIKEYEGWYNIKKHAIGEVGFEKGESGQLVIKAGYSNTHVIANFRMVRLVPISY